jgi:uncharacterized protein YjeT (DUF2065 family)
MSETSPEPNRVARFFGYVLIVIGGGLCVLSGLCTLAFAGWSVTQFDLGSIGAELMFGGPPFAIGAVLFWLGRKLLNRR